MRGQGGASGDEELVLAFCRVDMLKKPTELVENFECLWKCRRPFVHHVVSGIRNISRTEFHCAVKDVPLARLFKQLLKIDEVAGELPSEPLLESLLHRGAAKRDRCLWQTENIGSDGLP